MPLFSCCYFSCHIKEIEQQQGSTGRALNVSQFEFRLILSRGQQGGVTGHGLALPEAHFHLFTWEVGTAHPLEARTLNLQVH